MALVDSKGEALPKSKVEKVAHHPDQVTQFRKAMAKDLARMQQGWLADTEVDPTGATQVNDAAVDAHWLAEWENRCAQADHSRLPVEYDRDAMATFIKARRERQLRDERKRTHLHKLASLEEFEFAELGEGLLGRWWANNRILLAVASNGEVRVFLITDRDRFFLAFEKDQRHQPHAVELLTAVNYSVFDLMQLAVALRADLAAALPGEVAVATGDILDAHGS